MADLTNSDEFKINRLLEYIQDTFVKVPSHAMEIRISNREYMALFHTGKLNQHLSDAGFNPNKTTTFYYSEKDEYIISQKIEGDVKGPGKNPNYFLFTTKEQAVNWCYKNRVSINNLMCRELPISFSIFDLNVSNLKNVGHYILEKLKETNFQFGEKLNISLRQESMDRFKVLFRQYSLEKKVVEKFKRLPHPDYYKADWNGGNMEDLYNKYPSSDIMVESKAFKKALEEMSKAYEEGKKKFDAEYKVDFIPTPYNKLDAADIKRMMELLDKAKEDKKNLEPKIPAQALPEEITPEEMKELPPPRERLEFFDADKVEELIGD